MDHGQKYDDTAVQKYEASRRTNVVKCGLAVHSDHMCIAGSPDGFVENEGLIQVKCPFSVRYCVPQKATCFNKEGIVIKES